MSDAARDELLESLKIVRESFDADSDYWVHLLLCAIREHLKIVGVPAHLLWPLLQLQCEIVDRIARARGSGGGATKPTGEALALTMAAAAVTVLRKRGDCPDIASAVAAVSKATGIDRKAIRGFRDSIHRATAPEMAVRAYDDFVEGLDSWQNRNALAALGRFVK